jgi:predicted enzyme related to lactoylglutathione lyase
MAENDARGRFLWYDVMTKDPKGAQAFYGKVAGWGLEPYTDGGMTYMMFTRGGVPIGGSMQLPEEAAKMGAPSHWLAYIGAPDVDKMTKQALDLGAKTYVPPTDIPKIGRFSVIADPQGATIAFFGPSGEAMASHPPEVGDISWHELVTTDPAAAFGFYQSLFGWEKTGEHDMGPMGVYHMFGRQGFTLGGIFKKPAEMPAPSHWLMYIRVADINAAAGAAKANGAQVLHGPSEVPGGDWTVQCMDPQGAVFAFHQRKAG